jgi:uncharacterized ferredoxin-like protein
MTCAEFSRAKEKKGENCIGPICTFEALDLEIALGLHHVNP